MALFDIIDDITEKQVMKTETGDNRMLGVVLGIVVKNYDRDMPGRVCVEIPTRDQQANELKWARVAMPYSGTKWGYYYLPEIGDQVLLAFEQGNIEKPYIIGSIPKDANPFLRDSVHANNMFKNITTKNGNTIAIEDNPQGEGMKDKIRIVTSTGTHRLELDNEQNRILLSDKEGKNSMEFLTDRGHLTIKAATNLTIQVGETIRLTLNGTNGTATLESTRLNLQIKDSVDVQANANVKLSAGMITHEANGMLKINSNGPVSVQGNPIKLG
ncbi:MAG: hypothetical protein IJC59_04830 [Lachnospiraceae bacterium]|nr:hypothetical protein [Lachnospiraceae bacterium]